MIRYIKTIPKRLWIFCNVVLFMIYASASDSCEAIEGEPWTGVWSLWDDLE